MTHDEVLAYETSHPYGESRKRNAITEELGISVARYYQVLLAAAHDPEMMRAWPQTVKRVLAQTDRKAVARAVRKLAS